MVRESIKNWRSQLKTDKTLMTDMVIAMNKRRGTRKRIMTTVSIMGRRLEKTSRRSRSSMISSLRKCTKSSN